MFPLQLLATFADRRFELELDLAELFDLPLQSTEYNSLPQNAASDRLVHGLVGEWPCSCVRPVDCGWPRRVYLSRRGKEEGR